jgi:dienelactone hydrolase
VTRVRNFSPWAYWMLHLQSVVAADPCPTGDPAAVPVWRERCRERLAAVLGPDPEPVPPDVEVRDTVDCGSYRRESIVFDTEPAMSVPAFLLVPHDRTAPGPAVLALHGHGPGKSEVCGLDDAESRVAIEEHHGDYGHQLAARGYVVLAPDLRCFGERRDWNPPDKYGCDLNLVHAVAAGFNPLAQNVWDLRCALDVLAEHPLVDPGRMGAVGLSYGGTTTLFLAATDARVRAAVVSGYFNEWQAAHRMPWNLCGSQVLPGMLGGLEHVDLGALIAPRPLLVESGTEDLIFPADAAVREVARLATVYAALGVPEGLEHDVFEGGHRWHGIRSHDFLDRWLRPAP